MTTVAQCRESPIPMAGNLLKRTLVYFTLYCVKANTHKLDAVVAKRLRPHCDMQKEIVI